MSAVICIHKAPRWTRCRRAGPAETTRRNVPGQAMPPANSPMSGGDSSPRRFRYSEAGPARRDRLAGWFGLVLLGPERARSVGRLPREHFLPLGPEILRGGPIARLLHPEVGSLQDGVGDAR